MKNGYKGGVTEKSVHLPCALFSVIAMMPVKDIDNKCSKESSGI